MTDEQKKAIEQLNAAIRALEDSGLRLVQDMEINGRGWYSPVGYATYRDEPGAVILLPF